MSDVTPMVCAKCNGPLMRDWAGWTHKPVPGDAPGARRHKPKPVPSN